MGALRIMMMGMVVLVSGCAGAGHRQDLARLQSQVGLLDERVSQLERSGLGGSAATPLIETTASWDAAVGTTIPPAQASSGSGQASASSALKPSTREIQQALKNAGFYQGAVDGKMGPLTREAIREFQRVHGLGDDGVVGKQTWAKLKAYAELSGGSGEATASESLK